MTVVLEEAVVVEDVVVVFDMVEVVGVEDVAVGALNIICSVFPAARLPDAGLGA